MRLRWCVRPVCSRCATATASGTRAHRSCCLTATVWRWPASSPRTTGQRSLSESTSATGPRSCVRWWWTHAAVRCYTTTPAVTSPAGAGASRTAARRSG
ncbi:ORFL47W.iORF1 [Human betaherpesvirus 5]|nr:ORFL47W.iORF1 [Human betaherpesvirus 5]QHX40346.1 ORFL47W.iORF1 [Human betaherpesvirus 5]